MTNHSLSLAVLRWQIMSYDFFITTFILSICMCDEPMWQSQTYKHARHFFFYFSLSFARAHTLSLSLSSFSFFFSVISIKATNDNAASSNFDWSHIFDTHTFFFSPSSSSSFMSLPSVSLRRARLLIEQFRPLLLLLRLFFAHTDIVLISGIFVRLLMLLVMT